MRNGSPVLHDDPSRRPGAVAHTYAPRTEDVREARHLVTDQLLAAGRPQPLVETAALLLGELAANAVRHAHSEFTVAVDATPEVVRVEVGDHDPTPPTCRLPEPGQTSGWGMHLVDRFSRRWGVDPLPGGGKCVWFELDATPAGIAALR